MDHEPVELVDGFRELFAFTGHKTRIQVVVDAFLPSQLSDKHPRFISADCKRMIVWSDKGSSASFIFPSLVQRYILSIVYVHSLKVFVAAAADLSFKIFDLQLHLIESIRHEERTITALEYDDSKGALLIASAEGVSFWRIYRNIDYNCHVLERLFRFAEANSWVSRFICAFQDDKVYAVIDTSVQVLSIDQRKMVTLLRDIHFAQITAVSWYSRSKCYITGCMSGLIKVWTTRIVVNKSRNIANKTTSGQQQEVEKLCLLHTFDGTHTKAISGLVMHTIPGLCITASMDALIKLINLETFTELMTVRTDYPITSFRGSTYLGRPALVFTQENGTVRIWEVLSFLQFFGTSASRIRGLQYTENLQLFADTRYDVETKGVELETSVVKRDTLRATRLMRRRQSVAKEHLYTYASLVEGAMVVSADQDLRMLNLQGSFMCCLEPQFVVDGLLAHQCSIYQQILFCAYYTQSGQILKAFDATLPDYGLISEISPSIPEGDRITCLGLMNALPLNCIMGGSKNINVVRSDLRGSPIPYYIEELLLLGTSSGSIHVLDTTASLEVLSTFQVFAGPVEGIEFRQTRKELFVLGLEKATNKHAVKLFKLPDMNQALCIPDISSLCSWCVSRSLDIVAFGLDNGYIRLFDLRPTDGGVLEVVRLCETHEAPVIGLSFNDSLKVFAASSTDSVIKIYTTDKQLVRSIRLINPCPSVHFHGDSLLVAQKEYVLSVPKSSWDSDNYLKRVRANTDINWDMPSTEEEDSNISAQLLRGINRAGNAIGADTVVDNTVNTAVATAEDGDEWERASVDSTRGAVDYFSALDINVHGDSYKSLFSTLPAQPKSSKVLTPRLKAGRNVIVSKREDASSAIRGLFRI